MNHCWHFIILNVLHCSIWISSANPLEKPKTAIIEAFSVEKEEVNDPENVKTSSSELCPEQENESWKDLTSRSNNILAPELQPPMTNIANKDFAYPYAYNPEYNYYEVNTDPHSSLTPKSYNKIPYVHPEMFASFQPYPVRYIPPVYLKYYYLLPQDMLPNYELSNVRAPRVLRSNDDIWEQLESDSIMKNILPTMPVPFVRNTSPLLPYEGSYFPYGPHGCALLIMLGRPPRMFYRDNFANYEYKPAVDPVSDFQGGRRIDQRN